MWEGGTRERGEEKCANNGMDEGEGWIYNKTRRGTGCGDTHMREFDDLPPACRCSSPTVTR